METNTSYNLVHITTGGEYKTPLVASQLFDQAEFQAVIKEGFAPREVEVWIIGSMREYFDKDVKNKTNELKNRCSHINIRMINGISRLNDFPVLSLLSLKRKRLGKAIPVIYHCRGEAAARWALQLRESFPSDKVVLDVRGYWPAEFLYLKGIDDPATSEGDNLDTYNRLRTALENTINKVDAVTTVSSALRALLIKEMNAPAKTSVVPCCVNKITPDEKRNEIRQSWGLKSDEIALVYSGTTAAYQHLDDLTIPFLKKLAERDKKIRLVFLSPEQEKIKKMLEEAGLPTRDVIVKNFPQKDVATALTACDAGILIRKPTLVNRVANPVKIAEYLASGLPVIMEKGIGGVEDSLFEKSLLKGIEIAMPGNNVAVAVENVITWLHSDLAAKRMQVRDYAKEVYLWSAAVQVSRGMYQDILN